MYARSSLSGIVLVKSSSLANMAMLVIIAACAAASSPYSAESNAHTDKQADRQAAVNAMRQQAAWQFATAVLEGWERSNPPPQVGDRVGPGKGYKGEPLAPGTSGTVTGSPEGRPGCWDVQWTSGAGAGASIEGGKDAGASGPLHGTYCYGNGTYELAVLTTVPGLPGVDVVERVPVVEWTDDPRKPFAELAAASDTPLLFRGTAARRWRAHERWQDLDALLANVSMLEGVKVNRGGDTFAYYHRAPMNTIPSMVADYKIKTFTKHGE